jgi:hypothetical protein
MPLNVKRAKGWAAVARRRFYGDERPLLDAALWEECDRESTHPTDRIDSAGHELGGAPLPPTSMVTRIRRQGKRLVTDGPFAETREQLGG